MEERIEVRIAERRAAQLFDDSEGEVIGGIARRILIPLPSPKFNEILALSRELQSRGEILVTSWRIHRTYSDEELRNAELVRIIPGMTIEPAGEENGTRYDDSEICGFCGSGRVQVSPLRLTSRELPSHGEFVETIAKDEWIISRKWAEVFRNYDAADALFPLEIGDEVPGDWVQLRASNVKDTAVFSSRTIFGISPFDLDEEGRFRCPLGHVAGLNILSQAIIERKSLTEASVYVSDKYVGIKRGLLRPWRLLFVSQALWRDLVTQGMRGWGFEVVVIED
jgi:hypothetical protein